MNGSAKQIEWAEKVRRQIVQIAEDEMVQQAISRDEDDARINKFRAALKQAADEQTEAKFWIDARPNGRAPVQETFAAINVLRQRVAQILKGEKS
jgi:hypothetical protein